MITSFYDIPAHSYYHVVSKRTVISILAALTQPSCLSQQDYELLSPSSTSIIDTLVQILTRGQFVRDEIVFVVHYKKAKDCVKVLDRITGRVSIANEPNLISLPLYAKGTLLNDYYVNLDIANYHASVLLSLCKQKYIECPLVETYVKYREYWLGLVQKQYGVDRKDAKLLFSVLLTVGSFYTWRNRCKVKGSESKEIRAFREEVEEVTEMLVMCYPEYGTIVKTGNNKSNLNCLISYIVRDYENAILELILKYYKEVRRSIVLNGDGIYILKETYHDGMEKEIEAIVKENLGVEITVCKKEIEHIDLSSIPYERIWEDRVEEFEDLVEEDLDYIQGLETECLAIDVISEIRTFPGFCALVKSHKLGKNEVILNQKCLQREPRTNVVYETLFSSSMAYL